MKIMNSNIFDDFANYISPNRRDEQSKYKGAILIGQCLMELWNISSDNHRFDFIEHIFFNNLSTSIECQKEITEYEIQIISLPLRAIFPDIFFRESIEQNMINNCLEKIDIFLDISMRLNKLHGIPTFVSGFIVPQKKLSGTLLAYNESLLDFAELIELFNKKLRSRVSDFKNCYFFDLNESASIYGKRFITDEIWSHSNHGSFLAGNYGFHDWDSKRIEKTEDFTKPFKPHVDEFIKSLWTQFSDAVDVIKIKNPIKLVIIDLDDTLWRGVLAEETSVNHAKLIEGWPLGLMEALLIIKKRGVLLAIASNNDHDVIESLWDKVFHGRLFLSDFASIRINWDDKAKKIAEILNEINLLPANTMFIDDNPRERSRIKDVFPEMCVVEVPYYDWKRTLLWSSATQVPFLTEESKNKTSLIQQMIHRNKSADGQNRDSYLHSLDIKLIPQRLSPDVDDLRAFELINKTNQFNCAGKKFQKSEFDDFFNKNQIIQFECKDKLSHYGIIAIIILEGSAVKQFVMSCRVFGLDLELAIVSYLQKISNDVKESLHKSSTALTQAL